MPRLSRSLVRNLLIVLVALDLVVLAGFSVSLDTTTTRTTSAPAAAQIPVTTVVPPVPTTPTPIDPGVPLATGAAPIAGVAPAPAIPPAPAPKAPTVTPASASASASDGPGTSAPASSVRTAPCPVHLGDHRTDGGLQSLVDFAPAFGPFSAEAFAMASAYQPALQLIGPILATYPALAPEIGPLLDPLLGAWGQLLDQGFVLLGPLYSPYRTTVLEAETKLAAALAPYSQQLAASPLGGCLIEVQNALLHDVAG